MGDIKELVQDNLHGKRITKTVMFGVETKFYLYSSYSGSMDLG